jgi:hypothetical protein
MRHRSGSERPESVSRKGGIATAAAVLGMSAIFAASASTAAAQACPTAPTANCLMASKSRFLVWDADNDAKDQLAWRWGRGEGFVRAAVDDPTGSSAYSFCIYTGSAQARVAEATIPPGARWKSKKKGYSFKGTSPNGLTYLKLKADESSKASAGVKGRGTDLPDGLLPFATPVTVQLVKNDSSFCLETSFSDTDIKVNAPNRFDARREIVLPWPEGTLPPTSLCNKAGDDGSVAEQLGAQIRRSGAEWATSCLREYGASSPVCDVLFGGDSSSPYVPDDVPSLICPNEGVCDQSLGRVEWHAEDKFNRRCTLDEWALVWGWVQQRSRAPGPPPCDVTAFAPRSWGVYPCYEENFVLPAMRDQLTKLRSYVSPNPPMTPECEGAIMERMWWRLGSDWIGKGDYVCPQGYHDPEMQNACGTHTATPKIDEATWDAWCTDFADILRPVYEGARASSNKPYWPY